MAYTEKEIKFLKALKAQGVSQDEAFKRLSVVKGGQEQSNGMASTNPNTNTPSVLGVLAQPITNGFNVIGKELNQVGKLGGDIYANLTGQAQAPEDRGILSKAISAGEDASKRLVDTVRAHNADKSYFQDPYYSQKLFTQTSQLLTKPLGEIFGTAVSTLIPDKVQNDLKTVVDNPKFQQVVSAVKAKVTGTDWHGQPNPFGSDKQESEFFTELANYLPIGEGAKAVEKALPAVADNLAGAFSDVPKEPPAGTGIVTPPSNLRDKAAEFALSSQWKVRPTIRTSIRDITGTSPEDFALRNNLPGKDLGETIANTEQFKINKLNEKMSAIADWGEAVKTDAQNAMAKSLRDKLEKTLSDVPEENDPELVKLIDSADRFIATQRPTYAQIEALKSLYDHYNPDGLEFDSRGNQVNPAAHQNAAYRRASVQKTIEEEGAKRGVDIKGINRDIRGAHELVRGLGHAEDRMANHSLISLGDTQIATVGALMGGDITGMGSLLFKKLTDNQGVRSWLAKKLYTKALPNENSARPSVTGDAPYNRTSRLINDMSGAGSESLGAIRNARPTGDSIANAYKMGVTAKGKPFGIKEVIEEFKKLPPEEQAKTLAEHPEIARAIAIDELVQDTAIKTEKFGAMHPLEAEYLARDIKSSGLNDIETKYLLDNLPKEVKNAVQKIDRIESYGNDYLDKTTFDSPKEMAIKENAKRESLKISPDAPVRPIRTLEKIPKIGTNKTIIEDFSREGPKPACVLEVERVKQENPSLKLKYDRGIHAMNMEDAAAKFEYNKSEGKQEILGGFDHVRAFGPDGTIYEAVPDGFKDKIYFPEKDILSFLKEKSGK